MTVNDGCTLSHICLNPLRCTTPIMNPDKNYGLWVITMHHCRFINCKKRTPRVRDVGNGGGLYMCGAGSLSGISVPLSQCELKADLKSKVDFKREKEGQRRIKYSHTDIYNFNLLGKKCIAFLILLDLVNTKCVQGQPSSIKSSAETNNQVEKTDG